MPRVRRSDVGLGAVFTLTPCRAIIPCPVCNAICQFGKCPLGSAAYGPRSRVCFEGVDVAVLPPNHIDGREVQLEGPRGCDGLKGKTGISGDRSKLKALPEVPAHGLVIGGPGHHLLEGLQDLIPPNPQPQLLLDGDDAAEPFPARTDTPLNLLSLKHRHQVLGSVAVDLAGEEGQLQPAGISPDGPRDRPDTRCLHGLHPFDLVTVALAIEGRAPTASGPVAYNRRPLGIIDFTIH